MPAIIRIFLFGLSAIIAAWFFRKMNREEVAMELSTLVDRIRANGI